MRIKVNEKALAVLGIPLIIQFYIIWALGYLNIAPQLYNYAVIHALAIIFTIGLLLPLSPIILNQIRQAINDKYYAATLLIFLAITYELTYLATVPPYYGLSLGASLDTATYLQSFASLTYYRKFLESFVGPFFGVHASPILLLIYPIYEVYPSIFTLMTIQVAILMLPMPLMYKLGMKIFNNQKHALATALLYILYPWITTAYAPFEVVTLAGSFMAMALIAMYLNDKRAYWVSLTLAMASVEYVPLFGIGLSIYQALTREFRKLAILTLAYSMAWLIADYYLVMYFSGWTHNIFSNLYGAALSSLLTSITNKLLSLKAKAIVIDPQSHGDVNMASILSGIVQQAVSQYNVKVQYLIEVFGPLAFMNFLEPQTILLMPWLAALLTNFTPYYIPNVYYTILISAVALPATIWILRKLGVETRKKALTALLVINTIAGLLMGPLTPLSGLYYGNAIPNWNAPVTNQYDLAMIQLANYIPWNASVAVPATAVPWYSITRYGWNEHGVPFLGPSGDTEYVVYSPLIPTGYPFSIGSTEYRPYIFDDGAWLLKANYTGPIKIINGFYYENTYVINPILPGTWQYPIAQIPPTNITIQIKTEVKPQQAITLINTTLLKTQLQQPQGIACGIGPGEIEIPGNTYIAQPITIGEVTRINTITIFASYITNLATAELAITSSPIPNQENTIYTYTFGTPWWCSPHSWATPITANPGITLKPGTYYIILTFPVQGQTICEQILNAPKALLINSTTGQVIRQLPCTLGTIITLNAQNIIEATPQINATINILGNNIEVHGNQEITMQVETKNIANLVLAINSSGVEPNTQLIIKLKITTQGIKEPPTLWYSIPTIGLIPVYLLLILVILLHKIKS
ncbi:hypothetical protein VMUT_0069 [Vulcanisaeta moutnovskia 768-28]|uniref:DUF2079 domain-containing protein n=1 Tax=Vulcanisaeta moutnovskia (strain 768-28) TaxID=985053 RepID=F0QSD5_VULM7|nr:DUF2079 domain-containing protein [Vulcanisaeta moutnovskia]ADY00286.1 hypothetical protein VMUT_0069 [Vulcanisaeta moutnovskia 768-28]